LAAARHGNDGLLLRVHPEQASPGADQKAAIAQRSRRQDRPRGQAGYGLYALQAWVRAEQSGVAGRQPRAVLQGVNGDHPAQRRSLEGHEAAALDVDTEEAAPAGHEPAVLKAAYGMDVAERLAHQELELSGAGRQGVEQALVLQEHAPLVAMMDAPGRCVLLFEGIKPPALRVHQE
jgi:hypothetical protein